MAMKQGELVPYIFEHEQFGKVRTITIDAEPWLVGKDIATALGYAKPADAVREHVPDKFKGVCEMETPGGKQKVVTINEAGMYKLVMRSKLPSAENFSDWVCGEVLPSIRKTGSYSLVNKNDAVKQNELLTVFAKFVDLEREKFIVANSEESKTMAKAQLLRELASASKDDFVRNELVRQAAKLLLGEDFSAKKPCVNKNRC